MRIDGDSFSATLSDIRNVKNFSLEMISNQELYFLLYNHLESLPVQIFYNFKETFIHNIFSVYGAGREGVWCNTGFKFHKSIPPIFYLRLEVHDSLYTR